jgi:N-acetylmuramoyl-L-alanine amidase
VLAIDGGEQPGAIWGGCLEKDFTMEVAQVVKGTLERHGVTVVMARQGDETVELTDRAIISNNAHSDYYIAIHFNAGNSRGYDIFYSVSGGSSRDLAYNIADEFNKMGRPKHYLGSKAGDRGKDYYAEVREPWAPAVLVECGFMDNDDDWAVIGNIEGRQAAGLAISKGMLKQLGIEFVEQEVETQMKKLIVYFTERDLGPALIIKNKEHCPMYSQEDYLANPEKSDLVIRVGGPDVSNPGVVCVTGNDADETAKAALNYLGGK